MVATTPEVACFAITYVPENTLLSINWIGLVSDSKLKTGYEFTLDILQRFAVKRIMIDTTKRQLPAGSNPQALFCSIFNEALQLINDTVFLAMVVPQNEYFLSTVTNRLEDLKHADNHYVNAEQFLTQAEAEAWLINVN